MIRQTDKRLAALEARSPKEDETGWPWVRLLHRAGEHEPIPPPGFNAVVRRIVAGGAA